jgi:hypothetical protein
MDSDTKAIKTKQLAEGAHLVEGKGVTVCLPKGTLWAIERDANGLTEGPSDDPLGTLTLDADEVKHLMYVLAHDKGHRLTNPLAGSKAAEVERQTLITDALLKQLARIGEAMKVKGVPDLEDLKEEKKKGGKS